jgi:uncharacterized protein (TIGR03083 family)
MEGGGVTMGAREPVVEALAEEWEAIVALGERLAEPEWELATGCPGWTVRDVMAHMVGTERSLLGDAPPPPVPVVPGHVKNEMGEHNEAWVDSVRHDPGAAVLEAFRAATARRLAEMQRWDEADFAALTTSPVGEVPYRQFMLVRAMDCWVHEQDIRVATARPGHDRGPAAVIAIERLASGLPFVVGKQAGAPEGSITRFDVSGALGRRVDVTVSDGRARVLDDGSSAPPTTTLQMDQQTLWRLTGGRMTGADALEQDLVRISGDGDLGRRVATSMAFMI